MDKLHDINIAFNWSYYITVVARDRTILNRRLNALLVDFAYKKWIWDHNVLTIDHTVIITFSGRTVSDGVETVTPPMVWDKIVELLEKLIDQHHIINFTYSMKVDNIEKAHETIRKSEQEEKNKNDA